MGRPRTTIGTFGDIAFVKAPGGKVKARVRFRDDDGHLRLVQATGGSRAAAQRALKEKLTQRATYATGYGDLSPSSPFTTLVDLWLDDLDLEGKIAPSTRALYERNMRQLVLPAFEHHLLREITVRKVDQFIKTLAATKSYSMAKQARTVMSLAFGLAVRYDALRENPVRETARLRKPPSEAVSLTFDQVEAIRRAARSWRRGTGLDGPKPDGQLEQIIEVMLGSSGRIGEVLAIRRCDIDVTRTPASVRICGTIVSPTGKPTHRQDHPKTSKSRRVVSVPSYTAEVLRQRLAALASDEPEQLIFVSRNGTPLTTNNVRRRLRAVLEEAGITGVTPHSFRRTAATVVDRAASEHGRGSVVGLAPSAAAAQALADDLGISCDNTAKWLHDYDHGHTAFRLGQLVILDEASLADTLTLDRITGIAAGAGAKVLLVGDPHQLQSVDAGGAFALLVDRRPDAPELTEIHRFTHPWEKQASTALRRGKVEVISTYARQDRIQEGLIEEMLDAAYAAWRADTQAGKASVLVTESTHAVRSLNQRARADRLVLEGAVDGREIHLGDGTRASVGDVVITRLNDRTLRTLTGGWVKNGDRWRITDIRGDGGVVVSSLDPRRRGSAVLPNDYAAQHVDLGYAVTAHRAQGITVDTAHVVVTPASTRENLYVAMSRGRDANVAYVALDQPDDTHTTPKPDDATARTILSGVLQHRGATLSAHQTIEAEYELHGNISRLAAELETIAADAQQDRFVTLIQRSGLTAEQHKEAIESTAFGPLMATLRCAEAHHHNLDELLPRIIDRHGLGDADDIAAVLTYRLDRVASTPPRGKRGLKPRLIAGLIVEPLGPMSHEDRHAIDERKQLIEIRARALAEHAIATGASWVRRLGDPRTVPDRERWVEAVSTIAAYRDRHSISSDLPIGKGATSDDQRADRQRALIATRAVSTMADAQPGRTNWIDHPSLS